MEVQHVSKGKLEMVKYLWHDPVEYILYILFYGVQVHIVAQSVQPCACVPRVAGLCPGKLFFLLRF